MKKMVSGDTAQKRALQAYRSRLADRGVARFEVMGRREDRTLIRALARRLAEGGAGAAVARSTIQKVVRDAEDRGTGGILAALLRAPQELADVDFGRLREEGRKVDL